MLPDDFAISDLPRADACETQPFPPPPRGTV